MKSLPIPKITLQPLPFFKKGTLVFENSGHVLRVSDRHYRCDLDCNGKCLFKEPQFKKINIERNFVTLLKKFEIDPDTSDEVLERLMRDNMVDIVLGPEIESRGADEAMTATLSVMAQEFAKKEKIKKKDIKAFVESYMLEKKTDYAASLAAMAFDVLRSISREAQDPKLRAQTFARIVRRVNLSNEGKIISIEFYPWGWYLLRLFDKSIRGYLSKIQSRVKILNRSNENEVKRLYDAALLFAFTNPGEALGQDVDAAADIIKLVSGMLKSLLKNDLKAAQGAQFALLNVMKNLPAAQIFGGLAPMLEQKPRIKPLKR